MSHIKYFCFISFFSFFNFLFGENTYIKNCFYYPAPLDGFKIEYFNLENRDNELDLVVEFCIGLDSVVECSSFYLNGFFEVKELFDYKNLYYNVHTNFSILKKRNKMCIIDSTASFILMKTLILPYNSILPYVLYSQNNEDKV